MISAAFRLWTCRWGLLRLTVACVLLWALATDTGARLARLQLASLPDMNYLAEIESLRAQERFAEAAVIADAGLSATTGDEQVQILLAKQRVEQEQAGLLRKVREFGIGALKGTTAGNDTNDANLERLLGALAADFFVVGDIRDLVIQGYRYARGDDTDEVIIALSTLGIVTTLAPEIDWAPSIVKAARKLGSLTKGMGDWVVAAVKNRRWREVDGLLSDVAAISRRTSPATAARLLKLADEPADVARLARFVDHHGAPAALALKNGGRPAVDLLKTADHSGDAWRAARAETILIRAGRKGEAGGRWLAAGGGSLVKPLLKAHPLVGALKGLWKGNAAALLQAAIKRLDGSAWWAIPALAAWAVVEVGLIGRRMTGGGRPHADSGSPRQPARAAA